jgi:hypothetical protein
MTPGDADHDDRLWHLLHESLGLTPACRVSVLQMTGPAIQGRFERLTTWYTLHDYMPTGIVVHVEPPIRQLGHPEPRPGRDEFIPWHNVAKLIVHPTEEEPTP